MVTVATVRCSPQNVEARLEAGQITFRASIDRTAPSVAEVLSEHPSPGAVHVSQRLRHASQVFLLADTLM
ncbi:hypothetical protein D3C79_1088800 [compost metagenome]